MFSATYARATLVGNRVTRVTNLWFKLRRRGFNQSKPFYFSLGEPDRKGNDSCRVFILYMHILYLHELVLIAKWLTRGMIIFADG